MKDKDSKQIWENWAGDTKMNRMHARAQAMRDAQRDSHMSRAVGNPSLYDRNLPPPEENPYDDDSIRIMAQKHLGIQIERGVDGQWVKIGDKFAGEKDQPLSDRELIQVNQIEKQVKGNIQETREAPKGKHYTKSGALKSGDADADGDGGPKFRSDPTDKPGPGD